MGRCVGAPVGSSEGMMAVGGDDGDSVGASEGLLDGASVGAAVGRCVGAPVGSSEVFEGWSRYYLAIEWTGCICDDDVGLYVLMMEMMIVEVFVSLEVVCHSYNYYTNIL